MTVALLVITDGRFEYIRDTINSFNDQVSGPVTERWLYDDSGAANHRRWLSDAFPDFRLIWHREGRQGFGGAIRAAWERLRADSTAEHIFHLEDDFTFDQPIDLGAMAGVLHMNPHIVQVALRRQPWNDAEREAGGVVELHPDAFVDRNVWGLHFTSWGAEDPRLHPILEHTLFWTTNPSLYRRSLIQTEGWPTGSRSEGRFTANIRARHPGWRFAYWGARDSGEWVFHTGNERAGVGY
jgi:hypothetical protein